MMRKCDGFALFLVLTMALLWQVPALAGVPEVSGSHIRDFHRLTFEWPSPTYVTANVDGRTLTINFERKADPNLGNALSSLKQVIGSHSLSKDGRTLTLSLKGSYRARAFVSGSVSGVDIIPSKSVSSTAKVIGTPDTLARLEPAAGEEVKAVPAPASVEPIKIIKPIKPWERKKETGTPIASKAKVEPAAELAPAAGEAVEAKKTEEVKAEVDESVKPVAKVATIPAASTPKVEAPSEQTLDININADTDAAKEKVVEPATTANLANESKQETVTAAPKEAEQVQETLAEVAEEQASAQTSEPVKTLDVDVPTATKEEAPSAQKEQAQEVSPPPAEPEKQPNVISETVEDDEGEAESNQQAQEGGEPSKAKELKVRARLEGEELKLLFPWQQRTAAAAFVRNNMVWVVFSNEATLDLNQVNTMLRAGVTIKQINSKDATVFYMPIATGAGIEVKTIEGTFRWEVNISSGERFAEDPVRPQLNTEPPLKPHVLMPFLDVAQVVRIKDPVIGDQLDVLPAYEQGKGVTPARSFPEFELLDAVQGLVVLRRSNDTTVDVVLNGVRISTHQGATITPDLPFPEDVKKDVTLGESGVLFPYEEWRVNVGGSHHFEIELIKRKIARSLVNEEAEYYRRIAELHLAYGEGVEALGYLQNIKRLDSEYFIQHRLSALQGAANFLLHRYQDAARNFRVSELKDLEETEFWRVMLGELLGKPTQQFDYEANYEPYIQHYPPILMQRIGIFAADRYIANREYNAALQIFDQLNEHKLINEVADYINYLMGKIALETQTPEDGYKLWSKIVTGKATQFVKVRAEFALIVELLKRGGIKEELAIDKLERLALRWRGDNLELAVLSTLSDIYEKDKNWPEAIRIWRTMNEAFPNTIQAVDATRKMDDAFVAIFDRGEKGDLTDIESLFLYNQYRELIPDDEVGDRIVEKIADLMVDLDMLGAAADLLEGRMRYRFEHVERSKVGARLAKVLLLDQKPEAALQALQLSVYGLLPEDLLIERNHLSAEALLALKRYDDLFLLLKSDTSPKADYFRLQAHWKAKDWKKLAQNGELVLKGRTSATAPLSSLERDTLVKLALAYVALEEHEQTAYLRDYFSPLMKDHQQSSVFKYLTQPYLTLTPDNFEQVAKLLDKTQTFLANDYGFGNAEETPAEAAENQGS